MDFSVNELSEQAEKVRKLKSEAEKADTAYKTEKKRLHNMRSDLREALGVSPGLKLPKLGGSFLVIALISVALFIIGGVVPNTFIQVVGFVGFSIFGLLFVVSNNTKIINDD